MIISMTGYGKGTCRVQEFEVSAEVRSLNHRFLDVSVKMPKQLENKETAVRELVKKYLTRGRISISFVLRQDAGSPIGLALNEQVVDGYVALLEALRERAKIEAPLSIDHLLTFSDLFTQDNNDDYSDSAWEAMEKAIDNALAELNAMRLREGEEIQKDVHHRVVLISNMVAEIESLSKGRSKIEFDKQYQRIQTLLDTNELDESRLEMEVALLAERIDVTEECIRLKSHNTVFLESIAQAEPAGRKLNFLLQEMNREANTIGAKASDAEIAHLVVKIKEEIEKLREQVQNIE
ncbi:YicC family protein [candidate division KSB1 bacterium]|nr:YicC family protein [candidate division KSB1 bacterium]